MVADPERSFPEVIEVVVEIPGGTRDKYEYDERVGVLRLDRVLSSAVYYNFDYGYIERTHAEDGDHTDAMLLAAVSPHKLREIEHFFETYKIVEDKEVVVRGWRERLFALQLLADDRTRHGTEVDG